MVQAQKIIDFIIVDFDIFAREDEGFVEIRLDLPEQIDQRQNEYALISVLIFVTYVLLFVRVPVRRIAYARLIAAEHAVSLARPRLSVHEDRPVDARQRGKHHVFAAGLVHAFVALSQAEAI